MLRPQKDYAGRGFDSPGVAVIPWSASASPANLSHRGQFVGINDLSSAPIAAVALAAIALAEAETQAAVGAID